MSIRGRSLEAIIYFRLWLNCKHEEQEIDYPEGNPIRRNTSFPTWPHASYSHTNILLTFIEILLLPKTNVHDE